MNQIFVANLIIDKFLQLYHEIILMIYIIVVLKIILYHVFVYFVALFQFVVYMVEQFKMQHKEKYHAVLDAFFIIALPIYY